MDALSDEDSALKQQLELCVKNAQDCDPVLQMDALKRMRQELLNTTFMTLVPKPAKFLRPHYGTLKACYETMAESDSKKCLADVLSVLAFTMSNEEESLKYRLLGSDVDIGSWGFEYVSNLVIAIRQEYAIRKSNEIPINDLMELVHKIVSFYMKNNAEPDAVDLLIEVENLDELIKHTDPTNYERTCLYLISPAIYLPGSGMLVLYRAYLIYQKFGDYINAFRMALFSCDSTKQDYLRKTLNFCDELQKKQCCFILARHGITFKLDYTMTAGYEEREMLQGIINNSMLSKRYRTLARFVEVMKPESPGDIYKAHFLEVRTTAGVIVDLQNLAAIFVNAFVNAGFGQDKLTTVQHDLSSSDGSSSQHDLSSSDGSSRGFENWLFEYTEDLKISAVASLGMIFLWDFYSGLDEHILKYVGSVDNHVNAGALLGIGILNCSLKEDSKDHAMGILPNYTDDTDSSTRIGAIMGLGIAYAGSQDEYLRDILVPMLADVEASVIIFTAISLGLIYVGSCDLEIARNIIIALSNRSELELEEPLTRLLPLAIGLLYLGRPAEIIPELFHEKIRDYALMTFRSCAHAGTGNPFQVQDLLAHCSQCPGSSQVDQGPSVLGIAMIAMADESGVEKAIGTLNDLLLDGRQNIRQAVPLALALLCVSNPKVNVMDTLCRLCHDTNTEVAMAALVSLGLIGAGTKNSRIAGLLHSLSSYYDFDPCLLFCVRIALGLLNMGKGLLTLDPFHSDRFLLSPTALAGLVVVLYACLDMSIIVSGKYHFVLYFLVLAMQPRMLMTVYEHFTHLAVPVRVSNKAVDGVKTDRTPILLAAGDKAELATEKYIPISPILEGFVVLKDNPDFRYETI